jgi:hypothetical protein
MYSRWYNVAVVVLWLAAMTWLVWEKILPSLLQGEPPDYRSILDAQAREPPVGWHVACNGRPLGWALSFIKPLPHEQAEIHSRVHFDRLPTLESRSLFGAALLQLLPRALEPMAIDADSVVRIDSLGMLLSFDSNLRMDRLQKLVHLKGDVEGSQLSLSATAGTLSYQDTVALPPKALLGGALSPQTQLPGLRAGQTWKVPAFNPLRPKQPMEMLVAKVEGLEPIVWEDQTEEVWLVTCRSDPGYGAGRDRTPRNRLWVRRDGTVLRQESLLLDTSFTFTRMTPNEAEQLERRQ